MKKLRLVALIPGGLLLLVPAVFLHRAPGPGFNLGFFGFIFLLPLLALLLAFLALPLVLMARFLGA